MTRRLAARCGIAAAGLSVLAVVCLVVVVVRDRSLLTALLTLVGVGLGAGGHRAVATLGAVEFRGPRPTAGRTGYTRDHR